jgi:integrative and conjugative element protein (TIGR02256 family)
MARQPTMSAVQSPTEELTYCIRGPRRRLVFTSDVLRHFDRNRQRRCFSSEAGGQLFACFTAEAIVVEVATGPYREDKRSRFLFTPDRRREQQDIDDHFAQRLHFLGNWHTHPQKIPSPSGTDLKNTRQRFVESEHALKAFLMVIVGLAPFPSGLFVALVDRVAINHLAPAKNIISPNHCGRG